MGPKSKKKEVKVQAPAVDMSEYVTELMKQFFEIQMVDIEKKIHRLQYHKIELKEDTEEYERLTAEYQREKGAVIEELKAKLEQKEAEKVEKRDRLQWLIQEIKLKLERYKAQIIEMDERYTEMVERLTAEIETLEADVRVLEDFKTNKAEYLRAYEEMEKKRQEMERQHQRNLFEIRKKLAMTKKRIKKDLESRLLSLSIEFQETSRIRMGAPIHRMLQENRAIENELKSMKASILHYHIGYETSRGGTQHMREKERNVVTERDRTLAQCIIQVNVIKALTKHNDDLALIVNDLLPLQEENEVLVRRFKILEYQVERKKVEAFEVRRLLQAKKDEASFMNEVAVFVRKNTRKLQIIFRNSIRALEEAMAIQLIPLGETEEERYLPTEMKHNIYRKRRDSAFKKKGKLLSNLQEILCRAQLNDSEKRMLRSSSESISVDNMDFTALFARFHSGGPGEGSEEELKDLRKSMSVVSMGPSGSDVSLPRSITPEETAPAVKPTTGESSDEDEMEETEALAVVQAPQDYAPEAEVVEEAEVLTVPEPGEDP